MNLPNNSPEKIRQLRAMPYQEYLVSSWWRLRRHARLEKAGGKCERCAAIVLFTDVHHVYYTRRGEERDSDLEVLCGDCHSKHHFDESHKQHIGQYEMIAREALRHDRPTSLDAFKDAFRERLHYFKLPIDHRFHDTITIVWDHSKVSLARKPLADKALAALPELPPLTQQEAVELCRKIGMGRVLFRTMPERYGLDTGVAAVRARAADRLKAMRCPNCHHQGAQLSGVQLGWLFCVACQHKWEIPVAEPGERSLVEWRGDPEEV